MQYQSVCQVDVPIHQLQILMRILYQNHQPNNMRFYQFLHCEYGTPCRGHRMTRCPDTEKMNLTYSCYLTKILALSRISIVFMFLDKILCLLFNTTNDAIAASGFSSGSITVMSFVVTMFQRRSSIHSI